MKKLGAGSTSLKEIVCSAGIAGAEGVVTVAHVDSANEAYRRFTTQYVKRIGREPNESTAPYSAFIFFGNVIEEYYQISINLMKRDGEMKTCTLVMDQIARTQIVPPLSPLLNRK